MENCVYKSAYHAYTMVYREPMKITQYWGYVL